ncbi:methylmalonyl-CoA mutase family protein [Candidatus Poriferisodalis sp.]|uniref:methylmalonyl-CoA mutase family protein n=1 Tax=Candidatus Poriferisodalis sp. TaxID=3101277 RepID=UPI003B52FA4D
MPTSHKPPLLADPGFAHVSEDDWESAAEGALRGALLSSLHSALLGGIETAPLYSPHRYSTEGDPAGVPGAAPYTRGAAATSGYGGWEVRQIHDVTLPGTPDAIATDTTSGVDAVTVARGWDAEGDRAALAAGIGDAAGAGVTIHLQSGTSPAHAAALLDVLEQHGVDADRMKSWLGLDPIAAVASGWFGADAGNSTVVVAEMCDAARSAAEFTQRSPQAVPFEADGSVFADAGASDATEVAAMLATGVAWLRAICDNPDGPGLDPGAGARLLGFTLSAGPDPFLVTAKCRALRMCWTRVLGTCGVDGTGGEGLPMHLHAVTSTAMLSALDPWVNMLRATTATFGAANGGVDAITVRPFDAVTAGAASSGLGWRVAANTQLILRHESRIGSVIDPAGGSWYLEDLTRKVAHAAWDRFREIEAAGGISAAVASGELDALIADERAQRDERIAAGDQVLVGVTDFVDSAEASAHAGASAATLDLGLGVHRWAAPYESGSAGP